MSDKWFVCGIPENLARAVSAAAKAHGVTVGHLVAQALKAHLLRMKQPRPAPPASGIPAAVLRRLEVLEAQLPPLPRPAVKPKTGGGPRLSTDIVEQIGLLAAAGMRPAAITTATGASRASVYRHIASLAKPPFSEGAFSCAPTSSPPLDHPTQGMVMRPLGPSVPGAKFPKPKQ